MRCLFYVASQNDATVIPSEKAGRAKEREWKIYKALQHGAASFGDTIDQIPSGEFKGVISNVDMAIVFGCKGSSKRIAAAYKEVGKQVMFIDKPHYRHLGLGEKAAGHFWRLSVDDFYPHQYFRCNRPADRFKDWKIELRPWRDGSPQNKHVLFAGSSQKFYDFHEVGEVFDYTRRAVAQIKSGWMGEIRYRPKPSWAAKQERETMPVPGTILADWRNRILNDLENCWCLVTWGSNAAIDALICGVPVLILGNGIAKAMGPCDPRNELHFKIFDPPHPTDEERHQWFCDLAYCQFTLDEFKSGYAWQIISERLPRSIFLQENYYGMSPGQQLIEQYKFMHRRGGYFRGLSLVKFAPRVGEVIRMLDGARTLLDYGCGQGDQYNEFTCHYYFGDRIMPYLYDPAIPKFALKPPKGARFDGVICTDVLEHIYENDIDETLEEIFGYAEKFAFFVVHTRPAKKRLADGRNCHVTLRDEEWWRAKITKHAGGKYFELYTERDRDDKP